MLNFILYKYIFSIYFDLLVSFFSAVVFVKVNGSGGLKMSCISTGSSIGFFSNGSFVPNFYKGKIY